MAGESFAYPLDTEGVWGEGARWCAASAHVTVVQGALLLGFGRKMDESKTEAIPFLLRTGQRSAFRGLYK